MRWEKNLLCGIAAAVLLSGCTPEPYVEPEDARVMPDALCYVDEVVPGIRTELKYAGSDNFVGRPIAGYAGASRAILRKDAALALKKASDALARDGYGLLIWDAYRPCCAMKDFKAWSKTSDARMKSRFFPSITKQSIYDDRYIGGISEHSWGIAVDITLFSLSSGKEVDMGGHHDFLDPSSATLSPSVTPAQRAHRMKLKSAMEAAGFSNYSKEWWHYRLKDSLPWYAYGFRLNDHLKHAGR